VPRGATHALDVGCGEGVPARALARSVPHVAGLERHAPTLRPRGRLVVVGLARDSASTPPFAAASVVAHAWRRLLWRYSLVWERPA
jgi:hypothetical protein